MQKSWYYKIMKKKIVLVIDDDEIMRFLVTEILDSPHLDVITASDGFDGLRLLRVKKPDLVILDILMPDLDGLEFTKITRSYPPTKDVPIIISTGDKKKETVIQFNELDVSGYLLKPYQPVFLEKRIFEILNVKIGKS